MSKYLLKVENVYRVPTVDDALKLLAKLSLLKLGAQL